MIAPEIDLFAREKRLAPAEQSALWAQWLRSRDATVRTELANVNLHLPIAILRRYFMRHAARFGDLMGYGVEALLLAIDSYDPKRQTQPLRYLTTCVYKRLCRAIREHRGLVRYQASASSSHGDKLPRYVWLDRPRDEVAALSLEAMLGRDEQEEPSAFVVRMLEQLPAHQREVVIRCGIGETTFQELATERGVSRQAVHDQWKVAAARIREQLDREAA